MRVANYKLPIDKPRFYYYEEHRPFAPHRCTDMDASWSANLNICKHNMQVTQWLKDGDSRAWRDTKAPKKRIWNVTPEIREQFDRANMEMLFGDETEALKIERRAIEMMEEEA